MVSDLSAVVKSISLHGLLPETDYYMTYEGSTTHPGCWETVTWVILNKPVYISRQMVLVLVTYSTDTSSFIIFLYFSDV